jgi:hypothetical protein
MTAMLSELERERERKGVYREVSGISNDKLILLFS